MPIQRESVQSLLINMMFNNAWISSGTAFVVQGAKGPLLITNRHNVTGRHNETGELLDKKHAAIPNLVEVMHPVKGKPGAWQGKGAAVAPAAAHQCRRGGAVTREA
jgi:hypothetical protein